MTSILVLGNSEGTKRCDAKCHYARDTKCDCICGGRYHGQRQQAQQRLQNDLLDGVLGPELQEAAKVVAGQTELGAKAP